MSRPPVRPRSGALATQRYVLRLPLAQAARLEALCEMYPGQQRQELLADVMALGLAHLESLWPHAVHGQGASAAPDAHQPLYLLTGPFDAFHGLVRKHHAAMQADGDDDRTESAPDLPQLSPRH